MSKESRHLATQPPPTGVVFVYYGHSAALKFFHIKLDGTIIGKLKILNSRSFSFFMFTKTKKLDYLQNIWSNYFSNSLAG